MSCNCESCSCQNNITNKRVVMITPFENLDMVKEELKEVLLRDDVFLKVVTEENFKKFYL